MRETLLAACVFVTTPLWGTSSTSVVFDAKNRVGFEENSGQFPPDVRYAARGARQAIAIRDGGAALIIGPGPLQPVLAEMRFEHADACTPVGRHRQTGILQYQYPQRIVTPHTFRSVVCPDLHKGIDLRWENDGTGGFRFELDIQPGADPRVVRFSFSRDSRITLDENGQLRVRTSTGEMTFAQPNAFQESATDVRPVPIRFRIDQGSVTFDIGGYDPRYRLRIDPTVRFSSYLGGFGNDTVNAVASDSTGAIYVAGTTASYNFPTPLGGPVEIVGQNAFVAKFSSDGATLTYTTILPVRSSVAAMAIDSNGAVYIAGTVWGVGLPVSAGAYQIGPSGQEDGFVAKLNSSGQVAFATYLGGSGQDFATAIAVDGSGNPVVAGYTSSVHFPVTGALQSSLKGGWDGFITKLNNAGTALLFSTFAGGSGNEYVHAVTITTAGDICIAGSTDSTDLSVVRAPANRSSGVDAFVACMGSDGSYWKMVTYIGGSGYDEADGIAADTVGDIYVVGMTSSYDFPTSANAPARSQAGLYDAWLAKITLSPVPTLAYSTYLGGSDMDQANAVVVDAGGRAWVTGTTRSMNFPRVRALSPAFEGGSDAFLAAYSADGSELQLTWLLGGGANDTGRALCLSTHNDVIVVGSTESVDFPVSSGARQPNIGGGTDGFVARLHIGTIGREKIAIFRSGMWAIDTDGSGTLSAGDRFFGWGDGSAIPVVGDWNGHGRSQAGVYMTAIWYLDVMGTGFFIAGDKAFGWGGAGAVPVVGDWGGDGRTEAGVFMGGVWYLDVDGDGFLSPGDRIFSWGTAAATPLVGDWNGDGRSKVGVFDNGIFYLDVDGSGNWTAGDMAFPFGSPTAIPVIGDWNGDGRSKVGLFDHGAWYLDFNGTGVFSSAVVFTWGQSTATPVIGDWNGSGTTKVGVFLNGLWYLDSAGTRNWANRGVPISWGQGGDIPIVGRW